MKGRLGFGRSARRSGQSRFALKALSTGLGRVPKVVDLVELEEQASIGFESPYLPVRRVDRAVRRVFDVVIAGIGLALAAPIFLVVAIGIKLDSPGPVFYRQERVGLHHSRFHMRKFRKMRDDLTSQGPMLTSRHDQRMTRVGRLLERSKLDELPQLVNVLKGDMSVIGPRPEVPKFTQHHTHLWNVVLSVKPGIFGPSQLRLRNESELYPPGTVDIEGFYIEHVLPDKLEVDAEYAGQAMLARDWWLLARGLFVSVFGSVTARSIRTHRVRVATLVGLAVAGTLGMIGVHVITGVGLGGEAAIHAIILAAIAKPAGLLIYQVPKTLVQSATSHDFRQLMWAGLSSTGFIVFGLFLLGHQDLSRLVVVLDATFFLALLFLFKLASHGIYVLTRVESRRGLTRSLIVGSIGLAPLSVAIAATSRHGFGVWVGDEALTYISMAVVMTAVRPLVLVISRPFVARPSGFDLLRHEGPHLILTTLVGSWVGLAGMLFANQRSVGRGDVILDATVFAVLLVALALAHNRWIERAAPRSVPRTHSDSALVAGDPTEISLYLALSSGSQSRRLKIVGVLTTHYSHRSSSIGGHRVLGEFADLHEILASSPIDKVVVLISGLKQHQIESLCTAADRNGVECVLVEQFAPVDRADRLDLMVPIASGGDAPNSTREGNGR